MSREYEVTWTMSYEAESPEDAVRQALAHFADIVADPEEGPNIFSVCIPAEIRYICADAAIAGEEEE